MRVPVSTQQRREALRRDRESRDLLFTTRRIFLQSLIKRGDTTGFDSLNGRRGVPGVSGIGKKGLRIEENAGRLLPVAVDPVPAAAVLPPLSVHPHGAWTGSAVPVTRDPHVVSPAPRVIARNPAMISVWGASAHFDDRRGGPRPNVDGPVRGTPDAGRLCLLYTSPSPRD